MSVAVLPSARGNVRVGCTTHALSERGDDLYETPACATQALLGTGALEGARVWEPAAGRRAITDVLTAAGIPVVSTELVRRGVDGVSEGVDFLLERTPPPGVCTIVTNPPYRLDDQFVRHGLALGLRVIVLMRWAYAEGAGRSDLIDRHLRRVWLGRERLPMMHRDGWAGPKQGSAGQPFAWFEFVPDHTREGFVVRRISWRAQQ